MNPLDQLIRDTLTDHAAEAPHAAPVVERTLAGSKSRRWQVPVLAAAAASAVAAGGIGAALAWQGPSEKTTVSGAPAGGAPSTYERCLDIGAPALDAAHWGDGSRVLTSSSVGDRAAAVLVSADEQQWASCSLLSASSGIVQVYPMQPAAQGVLEFSHSDTTPPPPDSSFQMIERFPENVAEVRLTFGSGEVATARAVDGFIAIQLAGPEFIGGVEDLRQYDASGTLVGGPELIGGDGDLPLEQRTLVPNQPIASADEGIED